MTYTEHDKWADDLCESDDVASPLIAEMISDRLNAQAAKIERLQGAMQPRTIALQQAVGYAQESMLPLPGVIDKWRTILGWHTLSAVDDEGGEDEQEAT